MQRLLPYCYCWLTCRIIMQTALEGLLLCGSVLRGSSVLLGHQRP